MAVPKVIHTLRQKPLHVRERILVVTMAVAAPLIITVWFATFHFETNSNRVSTLNEAKNTIVTLSSDPKFNEVFKLPAMPSSKQAPENSSQTANVVNAVNPAHANPTPTDTTIDSTGDTTTKDADASTQ